VAFGGRLLAENDRDEQRKLIKYNHRKPSVSRFDALQDVKPAHRRLTTDEVVSLRRCGIDRKPDAPPRCRKVTLDRHMADLIAQGLDPEDALRYVAIYWKDCRCQYDKQNNP